MKLLNDVEKLLGLKKPPIHKLKWKLPELRFVFPTKDAEAAVAKIRKLAVFKQGGAFNDTILMKEYGEGVFAYFIIRSDKRSEEESVLFDGYMIQEEEPLGLSIESGFSTQESLQKLGYSPAFTRSLTEWRFSTINFRVGVFQIEGLGPFIEFALPQTDLEKTREIQQKAFDLAVKRLGLRQKDALPADVITLQLLSQKAPKPKTGVSKVGANTEFKLG